MEDPHSQSTATKILVATYLLSVLILSSFDTSAIDGLVPLIQEHFNVNDSQTAIIRTSTSLTHVCALGLVWIFGDSFGRKKLLLYSVLFWSVVSLLSVLLGSESFVVFVAFRALGAAATAVFGVLIQVMLADLFRDRALGVALMIMSSSDMISGMLSGIVSSWIVSSEFPWRSGLIAGPLLTILPLFCLLCTRNSFRTVKRSETLNEILTNAFGIFSIKSYIVLAGAISLGMVHVRSYMFWYPSMLLSAWNSFPEAFPGLSYTTLGIFVFQTIINILLRMVTLKSSAQMAGTLIGIPLILWIAQSWQHGTGPFSSITGNCRAYPIVVLIGSTIVSGTFILAVVFTVKSYLVSMVCVFLQGCATSAEVSLSQHMLMTVVPSSSRAAAVALNRLISGIVSAPSAQLIGMLSDAIRGDSTLPQDRFDAYQLGLLSASVFAVAASICYVFLIFSFTGDCKKAEEQENQVEVDERECLNGKGRSESILETLVKSRATTVTSYY